MKLPLIATLLLLSGLFFTTVAPPSAEAGPRTRVYGKCGHCAQPIYCHYRVVSYHDSRPLYGWVPSHHAGCRTSSRYVVTRPVTVPVYPSSRYTCVPRYPSYCHSRYESPYRPGFTHQLRAPRAKTSCPPGTAASSGYRWGGYRSGSGITIRLRSHP